VTVYVDDMRAPYGRLIMCHMVADTDDELHAMADRVGVARKWHQGDHYDIALSKRALAVKCGAREITLRQCGLMCANRKATGSLGDPETAEEVWRARRAAREQQGDLHG
jgi:hypothetical protein